MRKNLLIKTTERLSVLLSILVMMRDGPAGMASSADSRQLVRKKGLTLKKPKIEKKFLLMDDSSG